MENKETDAEDSAEPLCYLPAHQFTYDKYGVRMGYSGHECWNHSTNEPMAGFDIIGRCQAIKLRVRPKTHGEAVMLYSHEHDEEFWIHILNLT